MYKRDGKIYIYSNYYEREYGPFHNSSDAQKEEEKIEKEIAKLEYVDLYYGDN